MTIFLQIIYLIAISEFEALEEICSHNKGQIKNNTISIILMIIHTILFMILNMNPYFFTLPKIIESITIVINTILSCAIVIGMQCLYMQKVIIDAFKGSDKVKYKQMWYKIYYQSA